jgi:hypothetical protein
MAYAAIRAIRGAFRDSSAALRDALPDAGVHARTSPVNVDFRVAEQSSRGRSTRPLSRLEARRSAPSACTAAFRATCRKVLHRTTRGMLQRGPRGNPHRGHGFDRARDFSRGRFVTRGGTARA